MREIALGKPHSIRATRRANEVTVRLLLKMKADVNAKDDDGRTACLNQL